MALQQNDAAGGSGSLAQSLLGIAVNGLSRAVDGALAKKYPLTSFNENVTYDAYGQPRYSAAPAADASAAGAAKALVGNPFVIAAAAAVVVTVVVILAVRK